MPDQPQVDVFFSYRSPYSYLAIARLKEWAESDGIDLQIRPVLPLAIRVPDFFARANPMLPPYILRDSLRMAEFHGIPFRWPNPDPVVMQFAPLNIPKDQPYIHRLTRLGVEAARRGRSLAFTHEVSTLIWSGAVKDWSEGEHLAEAVARAGLDLEELDQVVIEDAEALDQIIEDNQAAHEASGHWGVPTMVYNKEPFFGQDRIELLKWRVANNR